MVFHLHTKNHDLIIRFKEGMRIVSDFNLGWATESFVLRDNMTDFEPISNHSVSISGSKTMY